MYVVALSGRYTAPHGETSRAAFVMIVRWWFFRDFCHFGKVLSNSEYWEIGTILSSLSQGLKAGLAAGLIYGALVGILHAGLLEACRETQVQFISQNLISPPFRLRFISAYQNDNAFDIFVSDLTHFPLYWAIGGLVAGVFYGAIFKFLYNRLPGKNSRSKGIAAGLIAFVLGIFLGLSGLEVSCSPSVFPFLALIISFPISVVFGYLLGIFYDSFGAIATEEKKEKLARQKQKLIQKRRRPNGTKKLISQNANNKTIFLVPWIENLTVKLTFQRLGAKNLSNGS